MAFLLSDAISNKQALAASNAGAVELGAGTPSGGLTLSSRQLFNGTTLTEGSVPSQGLNRITGSALLSSRNITTVSVGPCAGIGIMPGAFILGFSSTSFDCAYPDATAGHTSNVFLFGDLMSIRITDETAGVLLLTIDNAGLICFGNGAPVSALSVNGTAVVDHDGLITNQRVSSNALAATSGTVYCPAGGTASVTTLAGRKPTVQLDSEWPARQAIYHPEGSGGGSGHTPTPEYCEFIDSWNRTVHEITGVSNGSFTLRNNDRPDDLGLCFINHNDTVVYRWI